MRVLTIAASLMSVIIGSNALGSSAFAQVDHKYCLRLRGHVECAYDTLAQCIQDRKLDHRGSCIPNSELVNR
jgi:hypothetical protein